VDALLGGAGSGVATLGISGAPGVPDAFTGLTLQVPFNDLAAVSDAFARFGDEIACAIVEPVAGNMGLVPPVPGFLEGLREVCDRSGALLVFDEVITGFRVHRRGAQGHYGVDPDLTCLGKILGGGLPAAAYGGSAELMDRVAPEGPVYQAGTLSGNPLAMAAGCETLRRLERPGTYERLSAASERLARGFAEGAEAAGIELSTASIGGLFGFFFHPGPVRCFADVRKADAERFRRFFAAMLERGIYLAPSPFEAAFVSTVHAPSDIDETLDAARFAFKRVARVR
jgi:glutamate-1-semialdehyde 2,1-aminomutase